MSRSLCEWCLLCKSKPGEPTTIYPSANTFTHSHICAATCTLARAHTHIYIRTDARVGFLDMKGKKERDGEGMTRLSGGGGTRELNEWLCVLCVCV